jgi:hypothetical protein
MQSEVQEAREKPRASTNRLEELDVTMARLDARIEKNKAELERNNEALTLKLAELARRVVETGK